MVWTISISQFDTEVSAKWVLVPAQVRPMMTSSNGNIFPRYWPFVRGIHRSPVNSPHKGQWRGTCMFSLGQIWYENGNQASRKYTLYSSPIQLKKVDRCKTRKYAYLGCIYTFSTYHVTNVRISRSVITGPETHSIEVELDKLERPFWEYPPQ